MFALAENGLQAEDDAHVADVPALAQHEHGDDCPILAPALVYIPRLLPYLVFLFFAYLSQSVGMDDEHSFLEVGLALQPLSDAVGVLGVSPPSQKGWDSRLRSHSP